MKIQVDTATCRILVHFQLNLCGFNSSGILIELILHRNNLEQIQGSLCWSIFFHSAFLRCVECDQDLQLLQEVWLQHRVDGRLLQEHGSGEGPGRLRPAHHLSRSAVRAQPGPQHRGGDAECGERYLSQCGRFIKAQVQVRREGRKCYWWPLCRDVIFFLAQLEKRKTNEWTNNWFMFCGVFNFKL